VKILSIETSCDETAITLLECSGGLELPTFKVLGNSLISQISIHEQYGGVYPMLAKREHQKNLPILLERTLNEADTNLDKPDVDYIAVTVGPGLEPALWVGILFAEELGQKWSVPVIPVNHMEGHIYSTLFNSDKLSSKPIEFPALALLVSGGHTELVNIDGFGSYKVIGQTRDDAVGEAYDKVARMLGLHYPGGPKISLLAEAHREKGLIPSFEFPRPMIHSKDFDFSFSGLKTSVLYKLKDVEITEEVREETAHAFEDAAVGVLIEKTKKALGEFLPKTLIVAGGVSLNKYLRSELQNLSKQFPELDIRLPEPSVTTDNAVMIGIAGYIKIQNGFEPKLNAEKIIARGNLLL
jgi:N6-L-threonylcarbamoyladenine synthase